MRSVHVYLIKSLMVIKGAMLAYTNIFEYGMYDEGLTPEQRELMREIDRDMNKLAGKLTELKENLLKGLHDD